MDNHFLITYMKQTCGVFTTRHLSQKLNVTKQELNRLLYGTPELFQKDDQMPPRWSLTPQGHTKEPKKEQKVARAFTGLPLVLVDLGNVHDVLTSSDIQRLTESKCIEVEGFADVAFNGPGVNPFLSWVPVVRAQIQTNDAADYELAIRAYEKGKQGSKRIFICSKDKGIRAMQPILKRQGVEVTYHDSFASLWETLKLEL